MGDHRNHHSDAGEEEAVDEPERESPAPAKKRKLTKAAEAKLKAQEKKKAKGKGKKGSDDEYEDDDDHGLTLYVDYWFFLDTDFLTSNVIARTPEQVVFTRMSGLSTGNDCKCRQAEDSIKKANKVKFSNRIKFGRGRIDCYW